MADYLLTLRPLATGNWQYPPTDVSRKDWEAVRLRRALKHVLRAHGLENVRGPVPLPGPDAVTPEQLAERYGGPGLNGVLAEIIAEAGRLALAGQLDLSPEENP